MQTKKIKATCNACQRKQIYLTEFEYQILVATVCLSKFVSEDLITLQGKTALHVVDRDSKFGQLVFWIVSLPHLYRKQS